MKVNNGITVQLITALIVAVVVVIVLATALKDIKFKYENNLKALEIAQNQINQYKLDLIECRSSKVEKIVEKNVCYNSTETGIYHKHLRNIIRATLEYLQVSDRHDWERLLLLTAITESDGGRYTRQLRGPAKGVFQSEPKTEKECLKWVKIKHPELYEKIKKLRVPAHLDIHEGEYNIAYGVAMAYMEYLRRHVNPKGMTTVELAKTHKVFYNTYLGKGTVDRTIRKLKEFNVNL